MPPAATKKIATAIRSANRAIVSNYNAANRAVNRAPTWVKWTVGIVAVAVILYVIWKLLFAGRKMEKFGTDAEYGTTWTRYQGMDLPDTHNYKDEERKVQAEQPDVFPGWANIPGDVNAFVVDTRQGGTKTYYKYKVASGIAAVETKPIDLKDGVFLFVKKGITIIPLAGAAGATGATDTGVNTGGCFAWPRAMINDKSGSFIKFGNNVFHYIDINGNINTSYSQEFINNQSQNATFTFDHITYNSTIGKTLIYNSDKSKILKVHNPTTSLNLYHAYFVDVKNYTRVPGSMNESPSDNNSFEFDVRKKIDSNEYQIKWDGMINEDGPGTRYSFSTPSYDGQSYIKMMECTSENDISNTCTFYMRPSQIPVTGKKFYLKDNTGKYFHATSFATNRNGIKKVDSAPINTEDYFTYTYNGSDFKILNKDSKYMGFHVTGFSNWIAMTDDGTKPNQFQIFPIKDSSKYYIRNNQSTSIGDAGSFVHPWDESVEGGNGLTLKPNSVPYEWDIIWEQ